MDAIAKLFDTYSLNARVKAAFFLVFPIALSVIVWFAAARSWGGAISTFIVTFGIISFAANQMSTKGNILQEKLYSKWGGAPTTIILRHSDERLDPVTKERYMQKLSEMISNFKPVSSQEEEANKKYADNMYKTAAQYLKDNTRDTKKYPLVFKENVSYGFSRNTRAVKSLGIIATVLSISVDSYLVWFDYLKTSHKTFIVSIMNIPFIYDGLILVLLIALLFWIFAVTEKWVMIRGFAYAKALYATCDVES